jgi:hypothetical protein
VLGQKQEKGFGCDPKAILESDERDIKYSSKESKIKCSNRSKGGRLDMILM